MPAIKGKVHEIGETVIVTDKFQKRDFIVEYAENPSYPEYIKFEAHQDNVDLLDKVRVGDIVDVEFNLRGRPWTNKEGKTTFFNTLAAWRITGATGTGERSGASKPASQPNPPAGTYNPADDDDLPF